MTSSNDHEQEKIKNFLSNILGPFFFLISHNILLTNKQTNRKSGLINIIFKATLSKCSDLLPSKLISARMLLEIVFSYRLKTALGILDIAPGVTTLSGIY